MKTHKTFKIMLMALMLFTASLFITGVDAEAKAYKAKTVKVTSGKTKTVKTKRKIKKVKIVSKNRNFTVKKTGDYKFKVSGTDRGKSQTVKVAYTNKYTQKFKIKTVKAKKKPTKKIPSYAQKIVNELKPLLADPDKGLQTALNDWKTRLKPRAGYTYKFKLGNFKYGLGKTISSLTVDEILKTYTASQKKALILEVYLRQRMHYSYAKKGDYCHNRNSNAQFKKLYNGTFKGVCSDGAEMAYDICQYLGIKAYCTSSMEMDHEWCGIYATDKNGTSYWHGIYTTSYPYSMKASIPAKQNCGENDYANISEAQVKKYLCSPNAATFFHALRRQVKDRPTPKPATTATPAPTNEASYMPKYSYKLTLLNKYPIYNSTLDYTTGKGSSGIPALLYLETENPNVSSGGFMGDVSTDVNNGERVAVRLASYDDVQYKDNLSTWTKVKSGKGYFCAIIFQTAGEKTITIYESVNGKKIKVASIDITVKDWDTHVDEFFTQTLNELTTSGQITEDMNGEEKMSVITGWILTNFKYLPSLPNKAVYLASHEGSPFDVREIDCYGSTGLVCDFAKYLGFEAKGHYAGYLNHYDAAVTIDGKEYIFDACPPPSGNIITSIDYLIQ